MLILKWACGRTAPVRGINSPKNNNESDNHDDEVDDSVDFDDEINMVKMLVVMMTMMEINVIEIDESNQDEENSPVINFNNVDFPAPLGPTNATLLSRSIPKSTCE